MQITIPAYIVNALVGLVAGGLAVVLFHRMARRMEHRISKAALEARLSDKAALIRDAAPSPEELPDSSAAADIRKILEILETAAKSKVANELTMAIQVMGKSINALLESNRRLMSAVYGTDTAGSEDEELLTKARELQSEYPGLKLEDAMSRIRAATTYGGK